MQKLIKPIHVSCKKRKPIQYIWHVNNTNADNKEKCTNKQWPNEIETKHLEASWSTDKSDYKEDQEK